MEKETLGPDIQVNWCDHCEKNTRHIFRFTEEYSKEEGPITEVECTKCGNTFTLIVWRFLICNIEV